MKAMFITACGCSQVRDVPGDTYDPPQFVMLRLNPAVVPHVVGSKKGDKASSVRRRLERKFKYLGYKFMDQTSERVCHYREVLTA